MTSLHDEVERKLEDSNAAPISFPLQFLQAITCDFSTESELGRGGYGVVYKGVLPNGKIIAVKKLFEIHLVDDKTFQNEVNSLMEIKHRHVVQFIGYCAESSWETIKQPSGKFIWAEMPKRFLCFEYLCNKSLGKYISDESRVLEWNMRYDIIKGICNGLNFLHEECRMVHLDLKPENILMDATMIPKIADFGLSRIFSNQQSRILTKNSIGSRGYMAPEYLIQGIISTKADIFSLGVLIIEIITGRRDYPYFQLYSPQSTTTSCQHFTDKVLASWRYKFESTEKYISMENYNQQVKQCITIALKCVDPSMERRPTANDVIQVLNAVEQMEASKQMPSEMESRELIQHNITKQMSNINTSGTVGDVKASKECLLPAPLWASRTSSQNHQEVAKESSDKTSECTDKLLVLNTIASKDLSPQSVTGEVSINNTDGKVVDEKKIDDSLSPMRTLFGSSASNKNDQEVAQALSEPQSAHDKTTETKVTPASSALLDVHPLELRFLFEPNKLITCPLYLTNNTDEQVVYRLVKKTDEHTCFLNSLPLVGFVDPGTICTLVVIMDKHENLPEERNVDLILQTGTNYEDLTMEELANTVHKVTLKGVCALQGETILESIPPSIKFISMEDYNAIRCIDNCILSIDAIQTEPLIIIGHHSGHVLIWNYDTQKSMGSIQLQNKAEASPVKFIARKGWCLVGSDRGFIDVYDYKKEMQKITSFKTNDNYVHSVAIHATQPYVLSAGDIGIYLWDWDKGWFGWKHKQTFDEHSRTVIAVAFNPEDYNCFVSASFDWTIKVWSLDSRKSKYTLSGHSDKVWTLDFFTRDGQQYLITGSEDKTAKIWDIQKKKCVRTLPHVSAVRSVRPHPKLPLLVTGTLTGCVYLWSSTSFRLKRILHIGGHSCPIGITCLNESGRVVVAHLVGGLSVIEIPDEEEQGGTSSNNENSISANRLAKTKTSMPIE